MSARAKYATEAAYQRSLEASRLAKRRRRGTCSVCGGETRYNGRTVAGPSTICSRCSEERNHLERRWTPETIIRAFQRFAAEAGRPPAANEVQGLCESQVSALSRPRILELEQVERLGLVLPPPTTVRREFGSWREALRAAGLPPLKTGGAAHRRR